MAFLHRNKELAEQLAACKHKEGELTARLEECRLEYAQLQSHFQEEFGALEGEMEALRVANKNLTAKLN